jgi:hypothetical protein
MHVLHPSCFRACRQRDGRMRLHRDVDRMTHPQQPSFEHTYQRICERGSCLDLKRCRFFLLRLLSSNALTARTQSALEISSLHLPWRLATMQAHHKPSRLLIEPLSQTGCWAYILWLHKVVPASSNSPQKPVADAPGSSSQSEHHGSLPSKHVWLVPALRSYPKLSKRLCWYKR